MGICDRFCSEISVCYYLVKIREGAVHPHPLLFLALIKAQIQRACLWGSSTCLLWVNSLGFLHLGLLEGNRLLQTPPPQPQLLSVWSGRSREESVRGRFLGRASGGLLIRPCWACPLMTEWQSALTPLKWAFWNFGAWQRYCPCSIWTVTEEVAEMTMVGKTGRWVAQVPTWLHLWKWLSDYGVWSNEIDGLPTSKGVIVLEKGCVGWAEIRPEWLRWRGSIGSLTVYILRLFKPPSHSFW